MIDMGLKKQLSLKFLLVAFLNLFSKQSGIV